LAERVHPESVYSAGLRRKGIHLRRQGSIDILDTIEVGRVMVPPRLTVSPDTPLAEVDRLMRLHRSHGIPVVEGDTLVGVVTASDLTRGGDDGTRMAR